MGILKFSDGVKFDTSGNYRIETRHDGVYVVGNGCLIPVNNHKEGEDLIKKINKINVRL